MKFNELCKKEEITMNSSSTIGFAVIDLDEKEKSQRVKLDIELLKTLLTISQKMGWDGIYLRVQEDFPIFVSNGKDSRVGIVLAPRSIE